MKLARYFLLCLLLIIVFGWKLFYSPAVERNQLSIFSNNVMTIDYRILIGNPLDGSQKKQVQEIIDSSFAEIDQIYNKWNPSSELSQLNSLKAYDKKKISPELLLFLQQTESLVILTDGRFDPTIEPLQQLWKKKLAQHKIPSAEELESIKHSIGWKQIHLENGYFYKDHDLVSLDLGGIAKGFCVDLIVKRLNQAGFTSAFVEWGGEIRVSGPHPENRPWTIFISRFENSDPDQAVAHLTLDDEAIATSGNYLQFWKAITPSGDVKTYSHVFDPVTLFPIEMTPQSIASVSVLAKDCMTADALATAALLFNTIEEAQTWVERIQKEHPEWQFWLICRGDERF